MAGDTANPRVWAEADVYVAPVGTTAPVNVTTALAAGWEPIGLIGDEGITLGREQDTDDKFAYGGILVRTVRSKFKRTFTVVALEDNATVFGLLNPGSTATTSAGPTPPAGTTTRQVNIPNVAPVAMVLELVDGTNIKRLVIPRCEVSEVADTTISDVELAGTEFTVTVYPSAAGLFYTEVSNDPQADVTP